MIGYGRDLPEDEAIGVAVGWWPCMPAPSGAYVQMNGDGSGHDRHRRAGERQRRRDGDADVRRRGARHATRGLLDPVSGHRRRAVGHGLVRLADDVQQRPRGPGRRAARCASSCSTRPPTSSRPTAATWSSPTAQRQREGLARAVGRRSPTSPAAGTIHGKGSGEVPDAPDGRHGRLRRPARQRVVPRAAADHAGRAREGRPRDRRRARAAGRGGARLRPRSSTRWAPTARSSAAS